MLVNGILISLDYHPPMSAEYEVDAKVPYEEPRDIFIPWLMSALGFGAALYHVQRGRKEIKSRRARNLLREGWVFGMDAMRTGKINIAIGLVFLLFGVLLLYAALSDTLSYIASL
jgi:hypothetical protein